MDKCPEIRDLFYSCLRGECAAELKLDIERHLKECTSCREEFESLREMLRITEQHQKIKPSHDLFEEVGARLKPSFLILRIAGAASVAAAAVILIILLFSLSSYIMIPTTLPTF